MNLDVADLTDADLTDADRGDADLTDATYARTDCPNGTNFDNADDTCVDQGIGR